MKKQTHRLREGTSGYQGQRVGGRDGQGIWDGHVHSATFKVNKQGLTVWSRECCSKLWYHLDGRESEKEQMRVQA